MHRSRLCHVIIDVNDLEIGAGFWAAALGTRVAETDPPYATLEQGAGDLRILLQLVPEPKTAKSRVHLDFETDNVEAEVRRLEGLGARRQQFVEEWWVMEDPYGNEFCVLPPQTDDFPVGAAVWGE